MPLKCALAALGIVVVLFADVIFLGASLAPLDYDSALWPDKPSASIALLPEPSGRKVTDSFGDIGAAAWEFEPAVLWMAHCIRNGESPWWNPYDAAGRMVPESLYDATFSPVTLAAALFGGSGEAISFVLLALYFVTAFSLILSFHRYLEVSFLASCTAAIVYLLSGFSLSNLFTQMGQPYFLAPLLLLALFAFADKPTAARFALAALVQAMMFTITLFPTMVLAMIAAYSIAMIRARPRVVAWMCAVPVLGLLLVSFLYLPIFEAHLNYLDMTAYYLRRRTPGYSLESALSLFTPKHFWQSQGAFLRGPQWPVAMAPWACYFGIVTSLVAASGVGTYPKRRITAVAILSGVLVAITFGQMFGIPPFTLIDRLPFFSFVVNEYWPVLAGIPMALLVALALDGLGKGGEVALAATAAAIAAAFLYLLVKLQLPLTEPQRTQVLLVPAFFAFGLIATMICVFRFSAARYARYVLIGGIILESLYYMNHLHAIRSHREEHLPETLQWVKQQLPNASGNRILNLGGGGLMPNWGGALQIPDVGTVERAITPTYLEFFKDQMGSDVFPAFYDPAGTFRFTRESLSLAGVRFVIAERTFTKAIARANRLGLHPVREDKTRIVFENPSPSPRVFLAGGIAAIKEHHHTRVVIQTESSVPGTLIFMDSFHPNWKATVDGVSTTVTVANSAFRAVAVPAGRHEVTFTYRPKTLTLGIWISCLTLLGTLALLFRRPGSSLRARYPR